MIIKYYINPKSVLIFANILLKNNVSQRRASDSVTGFSVHSKPADVQNVSCLGLCGKDICPKSSA